MEFDLNLTKMAPTSLNTSETKLYAVVWNKNGPLPTEVNDQIDRYLKITYREL